MDTPNKPSTNETRNGKPWNGVFREADEVEGVGYVIAHYREGKIHRDDDQPAYARFDKKSKICEHRWIKNGLCTRANGPACVEYDDVGGKSKEGWYNTEGQLHSTDDHPAEIHYLGGRITDQTWYHRGKIHRDGDKPAWVEFDAGTFRGAWFYTHGEMNRSNGPMFFGCTRAVWGDNRRGYLEKEDWGRNGRLDRADGPARLVVGYYQDEQGNRHQEVLTAVWYRNGEYHTPTAHEQMKWQATQNRQGGLFWPVSRQGIEPHPPKPGGVKAAAALAKANVATKATKPEAANEPKATKPKTTDRGDAR